MQVIPIFVNKILLFIQVFGTSIFHSAFHSTKYASHYYFKRVTLMQATPGLTCAGCDLTRPDAASFARAVCFSHEGISTLALVAAHGALCQPAGLTFVRGHLALGREHVTVARRLQG